MFSWIIWLIFIVLSIIVIVGYFGKSLKLPATDKTWWPPSDTTQAIAGFGILYLLPYLFYDKILYWREIPLRDAPDGVTIADWWYEKTVPWESPVGFLLIVFLILFGAMMKKDPKNLVHHKLAPYGLSLVGTLLLFHFFGSQMEKGVEFGSSVVAKTKIMTEVKTSPYFNGRTHYQSEAIRFWYGNIPARQAWDMVDTIRFESEFRHFNDDGSVLRGKANSRDTGLHQINLDESVQEIKEAGCDVEDIDCQFKVALLIYKKYGIGRWLAYERVRNLPISTKTVSVPVKSWSEAINIRQGSNCHFSASRDMIVRDNTGSEYPVTPDKVPALNSAYVQFSVPDGEPGTIQILCRD